MLSESRTDHASDLDGEANDHTAHPSFSTSGCFLLAAVAVGRSAIVLHHGRSIRGARRDLAIPQRKTHGLALKWDECYRCDWRWILQGHCICLQQHWRSKLCWFESPRRSPAWKSWQALGCCCQSQFWSKMMRSLLHGLCRNGFASQFSRPPCPWCWSGSRGLIEDLGATNQTTCHSHVWDALQLPNARLSHSPETSLAPPMPNPWFHMIWNAQRSRRWSRYRPVFDATAVHIREVVVHLIYSSTWARQGVGNRNRKGGEPTPKHTNRHTQHTETNTQRHRHTDNRNSAWWKLPPPSLGIRLRNSIGRSSKPGLSGKDRSQAHASSWRAWNEDFLSKLPGATRKACHLPLLQHHVGACFWSGSQPQSNDSDFKKASNIGSPSLNRTSLAASLCPSFSGFFPRAKKGCSNGLNMSQINNWKPEDWIEMERHPKKWKDMERNYLHSATRWCQCFCRLWPSGVRELWWVSATEFELIVLIIYHPKRMNIKCLPRIRGVPTSFYHLNMMFSTNRVLFTSTNKSCRSYMYMYSIYIPNMYLPKKHRACLIRVYLWNLHEPHMRISGSILSVPLRLNNTHNT